MASRGTLIQWWGTKIMCPLCGEEDGSLFPEDSTGEPKDLECGKCGGRYLTPKRWERQRIDELDAMIQHFSHGIRYPYMEDPSERQE